jgi:hypothetical protein
VEATWIEEYVDRETTVGRMRLEDKETAIKKEQDNMGNALKAGLTMRQLDKHLSR